MIIDDCMEISIIGTPAMEDWPETCSLPWNTFANRMQTALFDAVPDMCPQGKQLLERMLTFDPSQRITASEALHDPYFRDEGFTAVTFSPSSCRSTPVPMSCSSNDDSGHSLTSDSLPDNWSQQENKNKNHFRNVVISVATYFRSLFPPNFRICSTEGKVAVIIHLPPPPPTSGFGPEVAKRHAVHSLSLL